MAAGTTLIDRCVSSCWRKGRGVNRRVAHYHRRLGESRQMMAAKLATLGAA
jgi:hypothetical protein